MSSGASAAPIPAARTYGRALRRVAPVVAAALAGLFAVAILVSAHHGDVLNTDFERSLWQAGRDLMHGVSPYGVADLDHPLASDKALYPPVFIMVGLPLAALPFGLASVIWDGLLLAGVAGGLWLLGVRDWRCYALTLFSWPAVMGLAFGNVSLLLVLGVVLVWRWRDRAGRAALMVGVLVAMKLFLWPLIGWLLVTRRFKAALASALACAAAILVPWALLGFEGLARYPALLDVHTHWWGARSLSLYASVMAAGGPERLAQIAGPLAAVTLLGLAARSRRQESSFGLAILAAIASSPIVWQHYLILLAVAIALVSPRLSPAWALLPAYWLILLHSSAGTGVMTDWHRAVVYGVVAMTAVVICGAARPGSAAPLPTT
jgi:alpha-1,2-mannosyltransferase